MRIGIFGESFLPVTDGVARVMKAYADTLTARGHEVYVIAPYNDCGYRGGFAFDLVDYEAVKFNKNIPYKFGFDKLDKHFQRRIKGIDLDIVHAHGPVIAGHAGLEYAKRHNVPIVGTFHTKFKDEILHTTKSRLITYFSIRYIVNFFESCDEVWSVADGTANTLRSYGFTGTPYTMPNGTTPRALNISRVPEVRQRYGIREDVPVFLFVGRTIWAKNLKRILDSCKMFKDKGNDFQLYLVGEGPDQASVKKYISSIGLESNVVMTGQVSDPEVLDCIYHLSDLFLFPSIFDCAPMVLREAACQYLPGIVVRGSDTSECIIDMDNGILADDTNESVLEAMEKFLALSPEAKKRMGERAYQTIPLDWNGPLMDKIIDRYQYLIDEKKAGRL